MKPAIAITSGDCNGVGPEVVVRAIRHPRVRASCTPLLVGPPEAFLAAARMVDFPLPLAPVEEYSPSGIREAERRGVPIVIPSGSESIRIRPGRVSADAGRAAAAAIESGAALVMAGHALALMTAPVSKKALYRAGIEEPGQTEMLLRLTSSRRVAMMLAAKELTVGLVTIHLALRDVAPALTRGLIREKFAVVHDALRWDWGIRRPRLAILGLNPHAGEEGYIGVEDREIVAPVIQRLRSRGVAVEGPFPADGFFAHYRPGVWDGVIALYHDQGLIPFKMMADRHGVNVSAGLRIVRTSPAHGTAFDIAWRGKADHRSTVAAILLARTLAEGRRRYRKDSSL